VKNGSKMRVWSSAARPARVRDLDLDGVAAARVEADSPRVPTASTAFTSRPTSTWRTRSTSARTRSGASAGRATGPAARADRAGEQQAPSKSSSTATGRGSRRSGRANASSEPTTLVRRSISAVMKRQAR
jgi:hypothetical protein